MYPSLWEGFPWFNIHEDRQGAYYSCCSIFVAHPTECVSVAQGPFLGGSGGSAEAYTRPAWLKIPLALSAFPLLGSPQAPGNKSNPPKGGKSLRGQEISSCLDTLGQIRAAASTASPSATRQVEKRSVNTAAAVFVARPT